MTCFPETGIQIYHFGARITTVTEVGITFFCESIERMTQDIEINTTCRCDQATFLFRHLTHDPTIGTHTPYQNNILE